MPKAKQLEAFYQISANHLLQPLRKTIPFQTVLHRPRLCSIRHAINPDTKTLTSPTFQCQHVSHFISHTWHKTGITLHNQSLEAH
ncbi:Large structural [Gossypium arboreum]|uniref:Large structural n=1 Tax=Gossypium arboreum TaxID=29729 RepID=A0A0B0NET5_GOSAR|nr:Large structural [Gossypium arboreum]